MDVSGGGGCRGIRVDFSVLEELIDALVLAKMGLRGGGAEPALEDVCAPQLLADVCDELEVSAFADSLF